MKEKSGTGYSWLIFSVIAVVVPVVFAICISCIINSKPPEFSELLESIILVVFSIACSLLSLCYQVYKQKNDRLVKCVMVISGSSMFLAWSFYIISLTKIISNYAKIMTILSCVVTIILSYFGIKLGKKSDENDNAIIHSMHDNCEKIRAKLISTAWNTQLKSHTLHHNDLLCNPNEFDRIEEVMKNGLNN